jgi:hypothetical protein
MDKNSNHFSVIAAAIVLMSLVVLQPSLLIYWGFFAAPLVTVSLFSREHMKAGSISSPTLNHHY